MNQINRHNYETFFLLYVDNELQAAEKKEVDEFVQSNPDLQEELVMLQQSVLKPDDVVFDEKKSLLKNESIPACVREKLLLLLDDELAATERYDLEGLIMADPVVKKEWNILQQTKLLPGNTIVFEDKGSLYRKEEGNVVRFPWLRLAAAAVFIGFGVWGGLLYFNNGSKVADNDITDNIKTVNTGEPLEINTAQKPAPRTPVEIKESKVTVTSGPAKKTSKETIIQSPENFSPRRLTNRDLRATASIEKNNQLPKPDSDNLNSNGSNKTIVPYVKPGNGPADQVNPGNNEDGGIAGNPSPGNDDALTIAFVENSEENNDRVLFMDEEKIKKTRLGGIFRKVKRVLERSANIKTGGKNLKVANLEFAIQ